MILDETDNIPLAVNLRWPFSNNARKTPITEPSQNPGIVIVDATDVNSDTGTRINDTSFGTNVRLAQNDNGTTKSPLDDAFLNKSKKLLKLLEARITDRVTAVIAAKVRQHIIGLLERTNTTVQELLRIHERRPLPGEDPQSNGWVTRRRREHLEKPRRQTPREYPQSNTMRNSLPRRRKFSGIRKNNGGLRGLRKNTVRREFARREHPRNARRQVLPERPLANTARSDLPPRRKFGGILKHKLNELRKNTVRRDFAQRKFRGGHFVRGDTARHVREYKSQQRRGSGHPIRTTRRKYENDGNVISESSDGDDSRNFNDASEGEKGGNDGDEKLTRHTDKKRSRLSEQSHRNIARRAGQLESNSISGSKDIVGDTKHISNIIRRNNAHYVNEKANNRADTGAHLQKHIPRVRSTLNKDHATGRAYDAKNKPRFSNVKDHIVARSAEQQIHNILRSKKQADAEFMRNAVELSDNIMKSRTKIAGRDTSGYDGTIPVSAPNKTGKQGMIGEFWFISRMKNDVERIVTLTEVFQSSRHLKSEPADSNSDHSAPDSDYSAPDSDNSAPDSDNSAPDSDNSAADTNSGAPENAVQERNISLEDATTESRPTELAQMQPINTDNDADDVDNGVPEHAQTPESHDDTSNSPPQEPPDLSKNVFYSHWSNDRRRHAVANEERRPMVYRKRSSGAQNKKRSP